MSTGKAYITFESKKYLTKNRWLKVRRLVSGGMDLKEAARAARCEFIVAYRTKVNLRRISGVWNSKKHQTSFAATTPVYGHDPSMCRVMLARATKEMGKRLKGQRFDDPGRTIKEKSVAAPKFLGPELTATMAGVSDVYEK